MSLLALGFLSWALGALGALLARRQPFAGMIGATGTAVGGLFAAIAAGSVLAGAPAMEWRIPWSLPVGSLALRLDALAAAFLLPLSVVSPLCALYGLGYLRPGGRGATLGDSLAAFNVLLLSMAVVVTAGDLVLLLIAWEVMTVSSWALVVSDHEHASVRAAGLQYLFAAHFATPCLILLVLFLGTGNGSFEIVALAGPMPVPEWLLFLLALAGFGTKAGIVPMHVWLPDAHPAAPSHVSALMSAVMITMGFYGLARFVPLLQPAAADWWPYVPIVLGAVGALGGIAFALAQRDVKRVLAYSTIENAGLVLLAMGVGMLGQAGGQPVLAALGWTAALLHLWNHALVKTLLFLGFGAVAQGAGSRSLEALGGVLARWPMVGATLVLGAAAIIAMPGLNVFASELLLFRALLSGTVELRGVPQVVLIGALAIVALTGGLAAACFARIVGIGLLGSPRTARADEARSPGWAMRIPLLVLAAGCVTVGLQPHRAAAALARAVASVAPDAASGIASNTLAPVATLAQVLAAAAVLFLILHELLRMRRRRELSETWSCGYVATTPAMQYTASSFGEPLTRTLQPLLRTRLTRSEDRLLSATPDRALVELYVPVFAAVGRLAARLRSYHQARVSRSLLYIVVTVIVLLGLLFLPTVRP